MSNWEKTYEELLIERKNSDRRMLDQLLPILIKFHKVMEAGVSAEFKGVKDEITHAESLCRREPSKKRSADLKTELNQIKTNQSGITLQRFDELIDSVGAGSSNPPRKL